MVSSEILFFTLSGEGDWLCQRLEGHTMLLELLETLGSSRPCAVD
jgi:hypothetical protein